MFFPLLLLVHIQAVVIPFYLGIKSISRFDHLPLHNLIPFGFFFFGFASLFEMIDHTITDWIYVDHLSIFNWLFYSSLGLGLTLLSVSVSKNKFIFKSKLLLLFLSIFSYWIFGKEISLIFQIIISFLLIVSWYKKFKDIYFWLYPIFGIFLTTYFGLNLSITGDQVWHLFIGPSGSISVIVFYFVLIRSKVIRMKL